MILPNLILAGAPRCGTSTLFRWLCDHPEVCGSTPKEPFYLMDQGHPLLNPKTNIHSDGYEGYEVFFNKKKAAQSRVICEATTHYIYQKTALQKLAAFPKPVKILFSLREPASRVYSSFQYTKNNLAATSPSLAFADFVAWAGNDPDKLNGHILNPASAYVLKNDLHYSRYVEFLRPWYEAFSPEQIKVILLESLVQNPREAMREICDFLEIGKQFYDSYTFVRRNETVSIRHRSLHVWALRHANAAQNIPFRKILRDIYLRLQKKSFKVPKDTMDAEVQKSLRLNYERDNEALAQLAKLDLKIWRAPATKIKAALKSQGRDNEQKPSVLFAIFQTDGHANGGLESITHILNGVRHIAPVILTQRRSKFNERWERANHPVYLLKFPALAPPLKKFPGLRRVWSLFSSLTFNLRSFILIHRLKPVAVHANDIWAWYQVALPAKLHGIPIIFNVRDIKPSAKSYGPRWRFAVKQSQHVITLSRCMKETLEQRVLHSPTSVNSISYAYSVVDTRRFMPLPPDKRADYRRRQKLEHAFVASYVGQLCAKKGQYEFISKIIPYLHEIPELRLFFIGDAGSENRDYADQCKALVEKQGLGGQITFREYQPDIEHWLQLSDVGVLASAYEGLARVMIESVCSGLPFISFDVSSAREILEENDCGLVAGMGDYDALWRHLRHLHQDPELRRRMGGHAVEVGRALFSDENNIKFYEQSYLRTAGLDASAFAREI